MDSSYSFQKEEQARSIVNRILSDFNIDISRSEFQKSLEFNPQFPSLISIIEALNSWYISNLLVNIPSVELTNIPLPAIAEIGSTDDQSNSLVTVIY